MDQKYLGGKHSDTLNGKSTHNKSLLKESKTESLTKPQSLQTCVSSYSPVLLDNTEDLLMWLQGDSHVNHSALQEKEKPVTTAEICGQQPLRLLKKSNHLLCTLRTYQGYSAQQWTTEQGDLFTTLELYSETWPKLGMMQDGVCWELMMSARLITEKGCGYWPSPAANEPGWKNIEVVDKEGQKPTHCNQRFYDKNSGRVVQKGLTQMVEMGYMPTPRANQGMSATITRKMAGHKHNNLEVFIAKKIWPTPKASDYKGANFSGGNSQIANGLATKAVLSTLPTPTSRDYKDGKKPRYRDGKIQKDTLGRVVNNHGGTLNPYWVEWLMGWPIGATALKPLETDKFHSLWLLPMKYYLGSFFND